MFVDKLKIVVVSKLLKQKCKFHDLYSIKGTQHFGKPCLWGGKSATG